MKAINAAIIVEGEIGDIGAGSVIHEHATESARSLTTAEEARQFVEFTGVDVLAPAVGNMQDVAKHGARNGPEASGYRENRE